MNKTIFLFIALLLTTHISTLEDFYEILEVSREATQKEIKKAFRRLSLKYHPDRNPGNKEAHDKYVRISRAHEVLTDPQQKEIYDIYGEEGLSKEGNLQHRGKQKGPNFKMEASINLEDLYNGIKRQIPFRRRVICPRCHGTGGKLGKTKQCPKCQGRGMTLERVTMGFGMTMQMQQPCKKCEGKGIVFSERCNHCDGERLVSEESMMDIVVERGMRDKQMIVLKGQADQSPDFLPGDLIIILNQKMHHFFKERRGNDLYADMDINLKDALFGFHKKITHMDGREIYVDSDKITQPYEVKVIQGEGMPVHKFPSQKGDLFLKFNVKLPKKLNKKEKELIREIFTD